MIQQCLENEMFFHIQIISSICVHFARLLHVPFQSQLVFLQGEKGHRGQGESFIIQQVSVIFYAGATCNVA